MRHLSVFLLTLFIHQAQAKTVHGGVVLVSNSDDAYLTLNLDGDVAKTLYHDLKIKTSPAIDCSSDGGYECNKTFYARLNPKSPNSDQNILGEATLTTGKGDDLVTLSFQGEAADAMITSKQKTFDCFTADVGNTCVYTFRNNGTDIH